MRRGFCSRKTGKCGVYPPAPVCALGHPPLGKGGKAAACGGGRGGEQPLRHPPRGRSADDTLRLAVPGKMIAHSPAPFFRPLRKLRLRFLCHWQREAAFPLAQGRLAGRRGRRDVQIGRQGAAGVPEFSGLWLDFAEWECYTRYVRNSKRVFRVFLVSLHGKCRFPGDKTESGSVEGYRERPRWPRRRRGMQKLSGKRIGSGRHFGKCGLARTPKGQPEAVSGRRESLR